MNIRFVREYRPSWARQNYFDVVYFSKVCTYYEYDEMPKTAKKFVANAIENGFHKKQFDTLYKCEETIYADHAPGTRK